MNSIGLLSDSLGAAVPVVESAYTTSSAPSGRTDLWQLERVPTVITTGTYRIRNVKSGLYLALNDTTTYKDVSQAPLNISLNSQKWIITDTGNRVYSVKSQLYPSDLLQTTVANRIGIGGSDPTITFSIVSNNDGTYRVYSSDNSFLIKVTGSTGTNPFIERGDLPVPDVAQDYSDCWIFEII